MASTWRVFTERSVSGAERAFADLGLSWAPGEGDPAATLAGGSATLVLVGAGASPPSLPGVGDVVGAQVAAAWAPLGSRAWGWVARGGLVGAVPWLVLPDDEEALRLALPALLPELAATPARLVPAVVEPAEAAASTPPEEEAQPEAGLALTQLQAPAESVPEPAWQSALRALGATLVEGHPGPWPDAWTRWAPLNDLLVRAGSQRAVRGPRGEAGRVFGFPDLDRPNSRALLLVEGEPTPQVLALHRRKTGSVGPLPLGVASLEQACLDRGWRPPRAGGPLLASDGGSLIFERQGKAWRWDGSRERDLGTWKMALVSLLLDWHAR